MEKDQTLTVDIAKKLNNSVGSVIWASELIGFEKAYLIANAAGELKKLLTPQYMKPIMDLQGTRLGFKTDLDAKGGYPEEVVKNCLIEAVLMGVQPFGNQFNIIANNCYITKEGMGHLLSNFKGLSYEIVPSLPRINADKTSAAIPMLIEWSINGVSKKRQIEIPVKMNNFMGTDAVIGKATRKARAWLWGTITGSEIPEGDVMDVDAKVIATKINDAGSKEEAITFDDLVFLYENKKTTLSSLEQKNAERIIENKEEASYSKLIKLLHSK